MKTTAARPRRRRHRRRRADGRIGSAGNSPKTSIMLSAVMFGHRGSMQPVIDAIISLAEAAKGPARPVTRGRRPLDAAVPASIEGRPARRLPDPRKGRTTAVDACKAKGRRRTRRAKVPPDPDRRRCRRTLQAKRLSGHRPDTIDGRPRIDGRATDVRPIVAAPASCRAPTARRCSRAARRRPRRRHARHRRRRADHRRAGRPVRRALHAALQLPARSRSGNRPHGRPAAARSATASSPGAPCTRSCCRRRKFPYTIRVVSRSPGSNGSSSMASVCGSSLALMDAGRAAEAADRRHRHGPHQGRRALRRLSDILGDEDHLGDMDFKVAGTSRHHLAPDGHQDHRHHRGDHEGRAGARRRTAAHILGEMAKAIDAAAPKSAQRAAHRDDEIPTDKIREVIGSGGKVIREIVERPAPRSTSRTTAR